MNTLNDKEIINAWKANAKPWIIAIQEKQIESRHLITNQAIINALLETSAKSVLDIGCGEGWLIRELSALGIKTSGLDVSSTLLEKAKEGNQGKYYALAYEDISSLTVGEKFDALVCNFSLLGKESVDYIFKVAPNLLNKGGHLLVQTLHPSAHCEAHAYQDGWREGSWAGFSGDFCKPVPWYFRTTESWLKLFRDHGYRLTQFKEPNNPKTKDIASLIMAGQIVG